MKTTKEIKIEIKRKYQFALKQRDMWQLEELRYLNENKKKKASEIHEFVIEYQSRMNTLCDMYMYVTNYNLFEAVEDLRKDAE